MTPTFYQEYRPYDQRLGYTPPRDPLPTAVPNEFSFPVTVRGTTHRQDNIMALIRIAAQIGARVRRSYGDGISVVGPSHICKETWDAMLNAGDILTTVDGVAARRPDTLHNPSRQNGNTLNTLAS